MDNYRTKKKINEIFKQSQQNAKRTTCILCGKSVSSFCNSHVVPRFVLKNIAENGMVTQPGTYLFGNNYIDMEKGISNAETFHIICRDCDNTVFKEYESESALTIEPTNKLMAEIALKSVLLILSKRYNEVELFKIFAQYDKFHGKDVMDEIHNLDIRDYLFSIKRSKKIIDKNLKSGYKLLYWNLFPYVVPIAAQSAIAVHKNYNGETINDNYDYSPDIRMQDLHICVFPLKESTSVFLFYHKDDRNYVKFERAFLRLSEDEKQRYIIYLLFKFTENFLISPYKVGTIGSYTDLVELAQEGICRSNLGFMNSLEYLTGIDKKLIDWKEVPNLLSEEFKIR